MATDIWIEDYQLNETIMSAILDKLGLTSYYSGAGQLTTLTDNFNTMMRTVRARGDYHQVTLEDCFFYKYSNNLVVAFNNWRDASDHVEYSAALECYDFYIPLNWADGTSSATSLRDFINWNYDSNNNITGVTVNNTAQPHWTFYRNNNSFAYSTSIDTNNIQAGIIDINASNSGDIIAVSTSSGLFLDNRRVLDNHPVILYSRTLTGGYGYYFWGNFLFLEDYNSGDIELTPTPTPGGGDGGSTDLTETNGLLSTIISDLNKTPSGDDFIMPASGEIIDSAVYHGWESNIEVGNAQAFWSLITTQLGVVMTNDIRYIPFEFLGKTYTLDNRAFVVTDEFFANFLRIISSTLFAIMQYKIIRKLLNMFSSGVFGQIMRAYSRVDISDLF